MQHRQKSRNNENIIARRYRFNFYIWLALETIFANQNKDYNINNKSNLITETVSGQEGSLRQWLLRVSQT